MRGEAALGRGERSAPKAHGKNTAHLLSGIIVLEGYNFIVTLAVLDLLCNPLKFPLSCDVHISLDNLVSFKK